MRRQKKKPRIRFERLKSQLLELQQSKTKTMPEFQAQLERRKRKQREQQKQRNAERVRELGKASRFFSSNEIRVIRLAIAAGGTDRGLARQAGCSAMTIKRIRTGETYGDIK